MVGSGFDNSFNKNQFGSGSRKGEIRKFSGKKEYVTRAGYVLTEIHIGELDSVDTKFLPVVFITKFRGKADGLAEDEAWIKLNPKGVTVTTEVETFVSGVLSITIGDATYKWEIETDDDIEMSVSLASRPTGDKVEWDLTYSTSLTFWYQPALTATEIANGAERPDDIIGSYAVYIDGKQGNCRQFDGEWRCRYATGKFCHFRRWKATDALAAWTWCDLDITETSPGVAVMTITIPSSFLDSATFPVVLGS